MKVERKSLVEASVETLRIEIVRGRFRPGTRLTEMKLAEEMGIGRSTVRAALLELEKDDLVVRSPYSAWAVPELTARVIWEVYTLRGALEGLAARILASQLDTGKRKALLDAYQRLEAAEGGSTDRVEADLDFHRIIVQLADHERLTRQYEILSHKIEWVYRWSEEQSPRRIDLPDWHKPILDAILDTDPERAERAMRALTDASLTADLVDLEGKQTKRA